MDYRVALGIIAVIIGVVSYVPYFRDILRGKTKPHAFSWFVWGLLTAIGFAAQVAKGAGAGAWVTGITAVACFAIAGFGLFKGLRKFPLFDWMALTGSLAAIGLWLVTNDPVWSVILITVIDAVAFAPTFRKAYHKPHEETISTFFLSGLKFVAGIAALTSFSLSTWLYPASLVVMNWLFVGVVLWRRK